MNRINRPTPPTSSLPPLARLSTYSLVQVTEAIRNLKALYFPPPPPPPPRIKLPKCSLQLRHLIHDDSVPDSGYASAEDDEEEELKIVEESVLLPHEAVVDMVESEDDADVFDIDVLRSDTFERAFAIKWLTGFTARAEIWLSSNPSSEADTDADERAQIIDNAAALLSAFVGSEPEEALTRKFSFPFHPSSQANSAAEGTVEVELNDAPLLSGDHTSVGLQSWASSILLAERMCAESDAFGLSSLARSDGLRVLELGAGTGLLSIAVAKILQHAGNTKATIVATDYHPDVLENLQRNVETNFHAATDAIVDACALDWEHPTFKAPLDKPFDILLAADVVYHPSHAGWIKRCAERLLVKPSGGNNAGGAFWLIVALRATGRHEGVADTVYEVFPSAGNTHRTGDAGWVLAVLEEERMEKQSGCGRADEGGYRLFKIGWVRS